MVAPGNEMLLEVPPQNVRRHKSQHAAQRRHRQRGRKPDHADADQRPGENQRRVAGRRGEDVFDVSDEKHHRQHADRRQSLKPRNCLFHKIHTPGAQPPKSFFLPFFNSSIKSEIRSSTPRPAKSLSAVSQNSCKDRAPPFSYSRDWTSRSSLSAALTSLDSTLARCS